MAVRILVVDADPTVQRALSNALMQAGYAVTTSNEGPDALRVARTERPALVLIAANLPGVDGFTVVSRLRMEDGPSTHTPVILLLGESESGDRGKALRSGADDYLIKPFHPAELMARMRSLLSRYAPADSGPLPTARPAPPVAAPAPRKGGPARVIMFYGAKGGVGTTTVAINAAIALHKELGRRVCLIDANLQFGDHRVFMDLGMDKLSVVDLATNQGFDLELIRHVLIKHESGIDLLLAPPSPEMAELVTSETLPDIMSQISMEYDYVILDVDKRLDEINLRLMDAANTLCVVMTADLPCLKNVRLVLEAASHLGYTDDKVRLILNRSNAFTGINVKNAESALKRRIDFQIVNEYRTAIGALNSGAPFMYTKWDTALGRSVLDLVKALDKDTGGKR
jgi:pilus assembly protein CpaE